MKTGVLIMAYGTPTTPENIEPYYTRIRHGRPPTPELLSDLVRRYSAIGGTSPLNERTDAQVDGIRNALEKLSPGKYDVRFGSKYEPPMLEEIAQTFKDDGFKKVIGLVLAPHSSTMSTLQYMTRAKEALGEGIEFIEIGEWYEIPGFVEIIAKRVNEALAKVPTDRLENTQVLFSAHSLPEKILANGDNYPDQLLDSAKRAAEIAGVTEWDIAWQSAGRTADPWIGPDILDVLRAKRASGVTDIVSCPIGFVSDHLEVLFDIDIEAQGVAKEVDLNIVRTVSLNADQEFVDILANIVQHADV